MYSKHVYLHANRYSSPPHDPHAYALGYIMYAVDLREGEVWERYLIYMTCLRFKNIRKSWIPRFPVLDRNLDSMNSF